MKKFYSGNRRVMNARKVEVDGILFDSSLEGYFYGRLKLFGLLGNLELQKRIELMGSFRCDLDDILVRGIVWRVDFYFPGVGILVDTKGWATEVSKIKMKLFRDCLRRGLYDFPIKELYFPSNRRDCDGVILRLLSLYDLL